MAFLTNGRTVKDNIQFRIDTMRDIIEMTEKQIADEWWEVFEIPTWKKEVVVLKKHVFDLQMEIRHHTY